MSAVSDQPIQVWIVEDDEHYKITLTNALKNTPDIQSKRAFWDCETLFKTLEHPGQATPPDVILLDINLPGVSGIEGIGRLKALVPEAHIVMLTILDSAETIYEALRAGASGYLLKNAAFDQITDAIREASQGGTLMPAEVARKVLGFFSHAESEAESDYGLTQREKQVLNEMAQGYTQKQIATRLFVSPHTVNTHIMNIYDKLHVHSGIEAVSKALRERLIR